MGGMPGGGGGIKPGGGGGKLIPHDFDLEVVKRDEAG
jgi:hypothetical protein